MRDNLQLNKEVYEKEIRLNNIKRMIIGKTYDEANKLYSNLRIVRIEDKYITITMDLFHNRCNIILKNNIITEIDGFY
jgi:hypothetical protein